MGNEMLSHILARIYAAVLTVYMLLTFEAQVQSQCSTQSGTEAGFTPSTSGLALPIILHECHLLIYHEEVAARTYNRPTRGRSTKG